MSYSTTGSVATLCTPSSYPSVSKMPVPSTTRRYGLAGTTSLYHSSSERPYYSSSAGSYSGHSSSYTTEYRSRFTPPIRSTSSYSRSISESDSSKYKSRELSESRDSRDSFRTTSSDIILNFEAKYLFKNDRSDRYSLDTLSSVRKYGTDSLSKYSTSSVLSSGRPPKVSSKMSYDMGLDKKLTSRRTTDGEMKEDDKKSVMGYTSRDGSRNEVNTPPQGDKNKFPNNVGGNLPDTLVKPGSSDEKVTHERDRGSGTENSFTELSCSYNKENTGDDISSGSVKNDDGTDRDGVDSEDKTLSVTEIRKKFDIASQVELFNKKYNNNGGEKQKTVNNGAEKQKTVNNGAEKQKTVNNGAEKQKTVNNGVEKQKGESNGVEKQKGVSNGVEKQKGVSNGIEKQRGVSNGVEKQRGGANGESESSISNGVILGVHNFGQILYFEKRIVKKKNDNLTDENETGQKNTLKCSENVTTKSNETAVSTKIEEEKQKDIKTDVRDGSVVQVDKIVANRKKDENHKISKSKIGRQINGTTSPMVGIKSKRTRSPKEDRDGVNSREKLRAVSQCERRVDEEINGESMVRKLIQNSEENDERDVNNEDVDSLIGSPASFVSSGRNHTRGLKNLGNTCYMNAALQCLCNISCLIDYIDTREYLQDLSSNSTKKIMLYFAEVMRHVWSEEYCLSNSEAHRKIKVEVSKYGYDFNNNDQQDIQEFLHYFLLGIHDEVNRVRIKSRFIPPINDNLEPDEKGNQAWMNYLITDDSKINENFVGLLRSTLKFVDCGHESVTHEICWDLSLSIPKNLYNVGIKDCFDTFMKAEVLDNREMVTCVKCRKKLKCVKNFSFFRFPRILILHLKRFSSDEDRRRKRCKLETLVEFPLENLDLRQYAANPNVECNYNLFAVVNHNGVLNNGHFSAYCKSPVLGKWYDCNDSSVLEIRPGDAVSKCAYMLFYELSSSSNKSVKLSM